MVVCVDVQVKGSLVVSDWSVGLVTERLQVQTPELTRYKSVVLPLNRQLTHCSLAVIENKNLFLTDLPG